jgi:hypothetical protein
MDFIKDKIKETIGDFSARKYEGSINGTLSITVLEGKALAKRDLIRQEPYVIIHADGTKHKTGKKKGNNPSWGETLSFPLKDCGPKSTIRFVAWDADPGFDDEIGSAEINLEELARQSGPHSIMLTRYGKSCGSLSISSRFDGTGWPGHGGHQGGYGAPQGGGYGGGYGGPQQGGYGGPQQGYGGPQGGYGGPQGGGYGAPQGGGYGAPQGGGYGAPQGGYGAPQGGGYGAPQGGYGGPGYGGGYGAPQGGYGPSGPSGYPPQGYYPPRQ